MSYRTIYALASLSGIFTVIGQLPGLALIILLVAVFVEITLAIAVLRSNQKSATNVIFFFLSLATVLWLVVTYAVQIHRLYPYAVLLARLGIFFAAPMSSLFLLLADTIPSPELRMKKGYFWSIIVATIVMMGLNISPYAFTMGTKIANGSIDPVPGWGLAPFAVLSTLFSIAAIYILIKKFIRSAGAERYQMKLVLTGMVVMLVLIIVTVLLPIVLFSSGAFVLLTPLYALIFLGMTAYAIVKYGLFNIKVIATEALTVVIWITLFSNILVANTVNEIVIDSMVFVSTVVLGIILVKSVREEVRQREELQKLNKQIEVTNQQLENLSRFKSELLSLASHQIRSPLAAIKGFGSLVIDGSYGQIPDKAKEAVEKMRKSADELVSLINTLLDLRKVEEGKMEYQFAPTNLAIAANDVASLMKPLADIKHLEFTLTVSQPELMVNADAEKIKQVIQNLTDNAIKYTPSGFVHAELKKEGTMIVFSVSDSGLGVPKTLLPYLFEEFIRDDRVKKQILGTGLGLYIAQKITEAHGGKLTAESEGEGKGSTFRMVIPELKKA